MTEGVETPGTVVSSIRVAPSFGCTVVTSGNSHVSAYFTQKDATQYMLALSIAKERAEIEL